MGVILSCAQSCRELCCLAFTAFMLSACVALPDVQEGGAAIQPRSVGFADRTDPWGGAILQQEAGSLIGLALHTDNEFGVWHVNAKREVSLLARSETGYHPDGVAVWDAARFVVAVEGERKLQLWRVEGDRLLKEQELFTTFPVRDVRVADFDGDGFSDVLLTPYDGERAEVVWGNAEFLSEQSTFISAGRSPWHPVLMDWSGNGLPDILWAELDTGAVRLLRNMGDRVFERDALHRVSGVTARQLAVGDVDGNGLADIVVAVEIGASEVLLQNENGLFDVELLPAPAPELGFVSAAVMPDGTVALGAEGKIVLFRRQEGAWSQRELPAHSLPTPIEVADVDGDGESDLVIYHSAGSGAKVFFGPLWVQGGLLKGAE